MGVEANKQLGLKTFARKEKTIGSNPETMESRCKFWLPKKKRFCANTPLKGSSFCGNHNERSDGQWVQCPIDPSHSVLEENLDWHVKRCPLLKQVQSLTDQPYYQKGINAGNDGGGVEQEEEEKLDSFSSEMKRNVVYSMSVSEFYALIRKILSVHASICNDIRDSYKTPQACNMWIKREVDRKLPFQEKHVMQQVSILGNLEDLGVIKSCAGKEFCDAERTTENGDGQGYNGGAPAVVEFGAGKGYLTQMLADCYGIRRVFLVERKAYKLKADRSLRQKESLVLERLRIDIEDLNMSAVESLQGVPYLGIGKHLCGPATDLTLRCCLGESCNQDNVEKLSGNRFLRGLAIATCCHHLCQWKHYINKRYILNLGITKEEFHTITWFTSWAVDADHGSDISDDIDFNLHLNSIEKEEFGGNASTVEEVVRSMKAVERAVLGFVCKQIIDMGRLMWVKEHRLDAQLVKYVPSSISPENHLLLARAVNDL